MAHNSAIWKLDGHAVRVTHLDALYWPAAGFTKGDMLRYYLQVAPTLLPYAHKRPITVRVFREGVLGASYYQRDRSERAPAWLRSTPYQPKTAQDVAQLMLVDDTAGLIWLANTGSIEFHLWSSRLPDLNTPDQAIFDLDTGERVSFATVLHAALRLRDALARDGLRAYAKTSGGRGLHVYVPLAVSHTFQEVRDWTKQVAERLAAAYPDLLSVGSGATHQGERVAIDYAQNSLGRNTAAPYTLRAYPAAPTVSTPLAWDEIEASGVQPTDFTPQVVLERIQQMGDLFGPVLTGNQHIHS